MRQAHTLRTITKTLKQITHFLRWPQRSVNAAHRGRRVEKGESIHSSRGPFVASTDSFLSLIIFGLALSKDGFNVALKLGKPFLFVFIFEVEEYLSDISYNYLGRI